MGSLRIRESVQDGESAQDWGMREIKLLPEITSPPVTCHHGPGAVTLTSASPVKVSPVVSSTVPVTVVLPTPVPVIVEVYGAVLSAGGDAVQTEESPELNLTSLTIPVVVTFAFIIPVCPATIFKGSGVRVIVAEGAKAPPTTFTYIDLPAMPPGPSQVTERLLLLVMGPTLGLVPANPTGPLQLVVGSDALAVQEVALVDDQAVVTMLFAGSGPPDPQPIHLRQLPVEPLTVKLTVGAVKGMALETLTRTQSEAVPAGPVQVRA